MIQDKHIFQGMRQDNHPIRQESQYLYDAKNIRLTSRTDSTGFSITTEKGTEHILSLNRKEQYFGHCIVGHWLVLFTYMPPRESHTTRPGTYAISRIDMDNLERGERQILFNGNLNLGKVQAIPDYESSLIQKVYWVDEENQPRVINVAYPELLEVDERDYKKSYNADTGEYEYDPEAVTDFTELYSKESFDRSNPFIPFDFTPVMKFEENVSIERLVANSMFPSGVLQYVCTYCNKYGQETNPFYVSPLLYISEYDRGGTAESTCKVAFRITINKEKLYTKTFESIRIYSMMRTSVDSKVHAKRVSDIIITENDDNQSYIIVDDGTVGEDIDETELLYIEGKVVKAGTIASKDNVLFLGNIKYTGNVSDSGELGETIASLAKNAEILEEFRVVPFKEANEAEVKGTDIAYDYNYNNQLILTENTTTFKSGETYRLGIQLLDKYGVWSKPFYVKDFTLEGAKPSINEMGITLPIMTSRIRPPKEGLDYPENDPISEDRMPMFSYEDFTNLLNKGIVKIRPLIAKPSISDRTILAQGILCPTVFNALNRSLNSPHAQSSWLLRPSFFGNAGYTEEISQIQVKEGTIAANSHYMSIFHNRVQENSNNHYSRALEMQVGRLSASATGGTLELNNLDDSKPGFKNYAKPMFFTDKSILTFHSPDIEFDEALQTTLQSGKYTMNIVGMVKFDQSAGDIDIIPSTSHIGYNAQGIRKQSTSSKVGFRHLIGGLFYNDILWIGNASSPQATDLVFSYLVSMWQPQGSLSNDFARTDGSITTGLLKKKIISNTRFSSDNIWFNKPYHLPIEDNSVGIFNSNEITLLKIKDEYNKLGDITYYGNVDDLITPNEYQNIYVGHAKEITDTEDFNIKHRTNSSVVNALDAPDVWTLGKLDNVGLVTADNNVITKSSPTRIKYKSTPHAVVALPYKEVEYNNNIFHVRDTLPLMIRKNSSGETDIEHYTYDKLIPVSLYWLKGDVKVPNLKIQPLLPKECLGAKQNERITDDGGYLYLAEIVRTEDREYLDNVLYGGKSQEALKSNLWIPAGESVDLRQVAKEKGYSQTLRWIWGDTWYQRYDCLKTYPFTEEDENQVVEIGSFMCETRVNVDGRTDRNRGLQSNLNIRPTNFNLINNVYSQLNTFFNYRILDDDFYKELYNPMQVLWTKAKIPGSVNDLWTNITAANSITLDGAFGEVTALNTYNDRLIAFQDKGLSQILFNSRVQINPTDGIPIEIANNGRVDGFRVISESIGCQDFNSVSKSPLGIYFIDKHSNTLYLYNGESLPENISEKLGNMSWFRNNHDSTIQLFYDTGFSDLYAVTPYDTLCFSEKLGQFVSRYDYGNSIMIPYSNNLYSIADNPDNILSLWKNFKGIYCDIFGIPRDFMLSFISNHNPDYTKVFDTLEFKSDLYEGRQIQDSPDASSNPGNPTFKGTQPFDYIRVDNEYQDTGEVKFDTRTLRKKFRIWRAIIPRHNGTNQRMRNPWVRIALGGKARNKMTIVHDVTVNYTI